MATAVQAEDDEIDDTPLRKSKTKLIIIIVVAVLLLSGIGGGVYYFFFRTPAAEAATGDAPAGGDTKPAIKETPGKPPVFLALESFTVNLKVAQGDDQQFLQIGISLQLRSDKSSDPIKQRMPQVRNRVLMLLTNSKASELSTTEGKEKLVEQILASINGLYPQMTDDAPVVGVFFTSFIIQ
jgi:flagellar FliL protein